MVQPILGEGLHKSINTRRQGLLGAILEAAYHNYPSNKCAS